MGAAPCCAKREAEDSVSPRQMRWERSESWHSIPDTTEEQWAFFEESGKLAEDAPLLHDEEVAALKMSGTGSTKKRSSWYKLRPDCRPLALVPEEAIAEPTGDESGGLVSPNKTQRPLTEEEERFEPKVPLLAQGVREVWAERQEAGELDEELEQRLKDGFPELEEWTTVETCRRFLRAVQGDEATAQNMLVKAIECRLRDRQLYATLVCEVVCDCRVIGRDIDRRPTVYMCAGSQRRPLREMVPQVLLAFEAAVRLSRSDGQIVLIADMHNFTPSLNMDVVALKDLAATFGTVFADRLNCILIVDFSFVAQSLWAMMKPMLSERTRKKINFVAESKARVIARERLTTPTCDRILSAFDINRDRSSTSADREAHARRTAICDVPLGSIRPTDQAG